MGSPVKGRSVRQVFISSSAMPKQKNNVKRALPISFCLSSTLKLKTWGSGVWLSSSSGNNQRSSNQGKPCLEKKPSSGLRPYVSKTFPDRRPEKKEKTTEGERKYREVLKKGKGNHHCRRSGEAGTPKMTGYKRTKGFLYEEDPAKKKKPAGPKSRSSWGKNKTECFLFQFSRGSLIFRHDGNRGSSVKEWPGKGINSR